MSRPNFLAVAIALTVASTAAAKDPYPPTFDGAESHVYKTVRDVELNLYVFTPAESAAEAKPGTGRPAIVFFFGGGWANGSPAQFEHHCRYLASRGMVAITADYRVSSRQGAKIVDCVRDAKSAIRWVREHAEELGVDPERIVASGGSAGGHIAACTGVLSEFDEAAEDSAVSSKPNAMVLFNPVGSFTTKAAPVREQRLKNLDKRAGADLKSLSPADHVTAAAPPTLIIIGTEDFVREGCEEFTAAMEQAGNRCELKLYDGRTHGFFNVNRGRKDFLATLADVDLFLESLGYVAGLPTVEQYFEKASLR